MSNELSIKNKEVLELFKQNAKVGTEEMGETGAVPVLKLVHGQAKAESCTLANGKRADNGKLFHPITLAQYDQVKAKILYIKKCELPSFMDKNVKKLNYILAGVLEEENVPFVTFIKGMALQPFWAWQKKLNGFITNPIQPVPMLALSTVIKVAERDSGKFGLQKYIHLEFNRDDNGLIVVEQNPETLKKLVAMVSKAKELTEFVVSEGEGQEIEDEFIDQQNGERSTYAKSVEEALND